MYNIGQMRGVVGQRYYHGVPLNRPLGRRVLPDFSREVKPALVVPERTNEQDPETPSSPWDCFIDK